MSPASRTRAKVLVVEDDDGLREGLRDLFEEFVDVDDAGNVAAALEALGSNRYSVVLTDLSMDGREHSGEEVIRRARAQRSPVVVLSGATDLDKDAPDPASRPDAYLAKPFQLETVVGLVEGYLRLERVTHEIGLGPRPEEATWEGPRGRARQALATAESSWLQLPAAASVTLAPGVPRGVRVLEGTVHLGGAAWGPGSYCFLSGFTPERIEGIEPSLLVTARHLP